MLWQRFWTVFDLENFALNFLLMSLHVIHQTFSLKRTRNVQTFAEYPNGTSRIIKRNSVPRLAWFWHKAKLKLNPALDYPSCAIQNNLFLARNYFVSQKSQFISKFLTSWKWAAFMCSRYLISTIYLLQNLHFNLEFDLCFRLLDFEAEF